MGTWGTGWRVWALVRTLWLMSVTVLSKALGAHGFIICQLGPGWATEFVGAPKIKSVRPLLKNMIINFKKVAAKLKLMQGPCDCRVHRP